ncbi:MAG: hypothetical protein WAU68_04020 [Vitreimonas sp.]
MSDPMMDFAFEIGKVYLKLELAKGESADTLKSMGGRVDERVVLQKIGKFWNQQNMWDRPDGLVVVTTHRFVFLSKLKSVTVTTDYMSVPFADMSNLHSKRVMGISPCVAFTAAGRPLEFTLLTGADEVLAAMQAQMRAAA